MLFLTRIMRKLIWQLSLSTSFKQLMRNISFPTVFSLKKKKKKKNCKKKRKKKLFFFLKKRQWGMKYASSIVWKKLTVTVVKLISSLSWSYCQKEHSYFNTLLMHYYDFFGWLFFFAMSDALYWKNIGFSNIEYWILKIFSITFKKSSDANLLCDFHWPKCDCQLP